MLVFNIFEVDYFSLPSFLNGFLSKGLGHFGCSTSLAAIENLKPSMSFHDRLLRFLHNYGLLLLGFVFKRKEEQGQRNKGSRDQNDAYHKFVDFLLLTKVSTFFLLIL